MSHSHFISIMEEGCEILERRATSTAEESIVQWEDGDDKSAMMLLKNQFSALTVQEPRDQEDGRPTEGHIVEYEIDEEDDYAEATQFLSVMLFEAFCLFEDLHNIRQFIEQTWSEYLEGKIDLTNTSVVTDTAIQLTKQLIEEFVANQPELNDDLLIQKLVYGAAALARGTNPESYIGSGEPYNMETADIADWCYLPTYVLLNSFQDVLQPGQVPVYKKGHIGIYHPRANRGRMTASQKFHEDKLILL